MTEPNVATDERKPGRLGLFLWLIPAIAGLYVLSIGPVMYTADTSGMSPLDQNRILSTFYWPIGWMEDNVKFFGDFISWYLDLWGLY